jgi:hypothetical protein
VHNFRAIYGDPDVVEVRRIFDDITKARLWENTVLRRLKVIYRDKWLNKTDNISIAPECCRSAFGKPALNRDTSIYRFFHPEYGQREYTRHQWMVEFPSLNSTTVCMLIRGRVKQHQDWVLGTDEDYLRVMAETHQSRSAAASTRIRTNESNRKRSATLKGRLITEEHAQKISQSKRGIRQSDKTRMKLRDKKRQDSRIFKFYCDGREIFHGTKYEFFDQFKNDYDLKKGGFNYLIAGIWLTYKGITSEVV